jgi:hypothetical protein
LARKIDSARLEAMRSYLDRRLLPELGKDLGDYRLDVRKHTRTSTVIICKGGKSSGLVLKMYFLLRKFLRAKKANELFMGTAVPSPRMLDARICLDARAGLRPFLIVQEEIRGAHLRSKMEEDDAFVQIARSAPPKSRRF